MSSGEVHNRNIWDTREKITAAGLQASNARWIPDGTVVIALNGQGKTRGTVALLRRPVTCNQSLAGILPGHDLDPEFLRYSLEVRYAALRSLTGDESRSGLNLELIRSIEVLVPSLREQRKIAAILSSIDRTIEQTSGVIERSCIVRDEVRRDLLSKGLPDTRTGFRMTELGVLPASWNVARLDSVATIGNGSTPSRSDEGYWEGGTIPWLPTGKVNDRFIRSAEQFITKRALAECPLRVLPRNTVLVAMIGQGKTRGMAAHLEIEACINQNFASVVPGPSVRSLFLFAVLERDYAKLRSSGRGSNQDALNCGILKSYPIPIPPVEEQDRIMEVLRSVESRIELESLCLEELRLLKEAVLRHLLSGEVRVTPDEAVA